jgi:hypothetical protein
MNAILNRYQSLIIAGIAFLHLEANATTLYSDNFDSSAAGLLPLGWTRYFNAASDPENNAVTDVTSSSPPNSFQVYGSHSAGFWAAHMTHPSDLTNRSGVATLHARFQCSGDIETTQSGHYFELQFGFDNRSDGQGQDNGIINVGWGTKGDGVGEVASAGATRSLVYGVWHSVRIQLDLTGFKYRTWVDDVELGSETPVLARPGWLKLSSGGGRAWVDDIVLEYSPSPALAIRVSQIELCWESEIGRTYQLQYRSALTSNAWTNLGSAVQGTGGAVCTVDDVTSEKRFYRIIELP